LTRWWHDDVDTSDTATSLVTAEVTVDEAINALREAATVRQRRREMPSDGNKD